MFVFPLSATAFLLFTCDVLGATKVWRWNGATTTSAAATAVQLLCSFTLPIAGAKVTSLALIPSLNAADTKSAAISVPTLLLCGDSRGSVYLYALHCSDSAAGDSSSRCELQSYYTHMHHTDAVSHVCALHSQHLFSVGRDGRIVEYAVQPLTSDESKRLSALHTATESDSKQRSIAVSASAETAAQKAKKPKPPKKSDKKPDSKSAARKSGASADSTESPASAAAAVLCCAVGATHRLTRKRVLSCAAVPTPERVFWTAQHQMMVCGFRHSAFVLVECDSEREVCSVKCGGGNRSVAFVPGPALCGDEKQSAGAEAVAFAFLYNTTAEVKAHFGTMRQMKVKSMQTAHTQHHSA